MSDRRFIVDASWWRSRDTVLAGWPLRMFRFTARARPLLDALESSTPVSDIHRTLLDRLLKADAIHERFVDHSASLDQVTVVLPVRDAPDLDELLTSLPPVARVVVVDDGSSPPIAARDGVTFLRHDVSLGPAAARNAGAALADTEFILFIDADVVIPAGGAETWAPLLGHFDDHQVGLVAPRVASIPGASVLARYEMTDSPLDMGPHPARLHRGGRLSYVPSAVIMVRTAHFRRHGGFDARLRFGEDVDLVWRFDADGVRCRYEPDVVVHHRPRSTWPDMWRQRFHYGTSAAPLEERHPGALAPLRWSAWTAAPWIALLGGFPVVAGILAGVPAVRLRRSLGRELGRDTSGIDRIVIHTVAAGHLQAGRSVARAMSRVWWPLLALAGLVTRRAPRLWMAAVVLPGLWQWRERRSTLDPVTYVLARWSDDLAYGAGVWTGGARPRRLDVIRPRLGDAQLGTGDRREMS
ncbi:MAG: mycofactocin biosynthesis glycosyltransferase MftF [Actinomycetota bacterium]